MTRGICIYKRQEVYERVWSAPLRDIAKSFGVSDVGLKKVCERLEVPTPPRGYWLRDPAKRDNARVPLPAHSSGRADDQFCLRARVRESAEPSEAAIARAAVELGSGERVLVNPTLTDPHRLVVKSQKVLAKAKPFDGLVSSGDSGLDISVSPASVSRTLRIMDALLKALEARSLRVEVTALAQEEQWGRPIGIDPVTRVQVDDEWIRFGLSEAVNVAPSPPGPKPKRRWELSVEELMAARPRLPERRVRTPTGNLGLTMSYGSEHRHWRDRKHRKLESFLNDFIAHLLVAADWLKQKRAAEEEEDRKRREAERLRAEAAERAAKERERIEGLNEMLEKWRRVRDIREFASQIRGLVQASSMKVVAGGPIHDQVSWMLSYAETIDPLRELRAGLSHRMSER